MQAEDLEKVFVLYGLAVIQATNNGEIQAAMYRERVEEKLKHISQRFVPLVLALYATTMAEGGPVYGSQTRTTQEPLDATSPVSESGKGKVTPLPGKTR